MSKTNLMRAWSLFAAAVCTALLFPTVTAELRIEAQGPNLIQNPSFELPYAVLPNKENCAIAAPWVAWWVQGTPQEVSQGYRFAPEYKAAFSQDFPGNRVRSGERAQQWFHSFGNFQAGVYQQVQNIPVGARLKFELWVMTWSCDKEDKGNCGRATSGDPSPMHVRIGIDPTGGADAFGAAIVWSAEQNAYDAWHHFEVEAVAQGSTVTLFVYSYPDYRSQDNNVYVDDASLVIAALPPTATRRPTNTATFTPIPTETSVPTTTATPTPSPTLTATATTIMPTLTPTLISTATSTPPPTARSVPVPALSVGGKGSNSGILFLGAAAVVTAFASGFLVGRVTRRSG